jgi:arylsulfatase
VAGRTEFTYNGPIVGIPQGTAPSILNRSFTITADVEVPNDGGEGMLTTTGGRFGGWAFYVLKGRPVFVYDLLDLARERVESSEVLSPGKHTVIFDFKYDGPGLAKGGTGVITVDGAETARQQITRTIPFVLEASETFDVGSDTGTGVEDNDYEPPFSFTGKLKKLTIKLGPSGLSPAQQKEAQEKAAAMQDSPRQE